MSTSRLKTSHLLSRIFVTVLAVTAFAAACVLPATAHASSAVCAIGTHNATWSPGVTHAVALHEVTTDTTWSCTQLRAPLFTTASSHAEFSAPFSCSNLFSTAPTTWTIEWGDAVSPATSTFVFTATAVPLEGNLVVTAPGSITSGRFSGHSATAAFVLTNLAATIANQCATPSGVTSASGTATLVIL